MVSAEPTARDIIAEHGTYFGNVNKRQFSGNVLGYVTPWNSQGYNIANIFTPKFTHISPVWLQVKKKGSLSYKIIGKHNVDSKWMNGLKKNNINVKITPRILFEDWSISDFINLFSSENEQSELIATLIKACKNNKFDGLVLELWLQSGGRIDSQILVNFVILVAQKFKENSLEIILVIPPSRGYKNEIFTEEHFSQLSDFVSSFSLMTYDYSNPQRPGPNSPLQWVKKCVEFLVPDSKNPKRSKILLGLNFYGNDYTVSGGGPIVGHDFIKLLNDYKGKLKFDNVSKENFFEVK